MSNDNPNVAEVLAMSLKKLRDFVHQTKNHPCNNCINCFNCDDCKNCNGCINCHRCFNCNGCNGCKNCHDCDDCINCTNVFNGLFCANLKLDKLDASKYWIANVEVTGKQFKKKARELGITF